MGTNHSNTFKRWFAAILLLVSGMIMGAGGMQYWFMVHGPGMLPPPADFKVRVWERFSDEIELTPDQEAIIRPEFEKAWEQGDALRRKMEPQIHALFEDTENRVRKYLTPQQQMLLDAFKKRMEERRRQHQGPPPPLFDDGPPPPPPHGTPQ